MRKAPEHLHALRGAGWRCWCGIGSSNRSRACDRSRSGGSGFARGIRLRRAHGLAHVLVGEVLISTAPGTAAYERCEGEHVPACRSLFPVPRMPTLLFTHEDAKSDKRRTSVCGHTCRSTRGHGTAGKSHSRSLARWICGPFDRVRFWADQSPCWPFESRCAAGCPLPCRRVGTDCEPGSRLVRFWEGVEHLPTAGSGRAAA